MIRPRHLWFILVGVTVRAAAAVPAYVEEALARFHSTLSPGWSCSVEVARDGAVSVERYDPSRPPGARWTLLSVNGSPPASGDLVDYARTRSQPGVLPFRAAFTPGQLERSTFVMLNEGPAAASVRFGFTEEAARADKMLPHLEIELLVRRQPAAIVNYRLHLRHPFTPVIGVRMHSLEAGADFDGEGRPVRQFSRFSGRILLVKGIEENMVTRYFDYLPATP